MSQKQERRDFILDQAFEVFDQYGLRKTTMEDIARRCGLKKASLYYYFKGKEEVIASLVQRMGERRLQFHEKELRAEKSAADGLRALLRAEFCADREGEVLYKLACEDIVSFLDSVWDSFNELTDRHERLYLETMRRGVESGELVIDDPDTLAKGMRRAVNGAHLGALLAGDEERTEESLEAVLSLLELAIDGLVRR